MGEVGADVEDVSLDNQYDWSVPVRLVMHHAKEVAEGVVHSYHGYAGVSEGFLWNLIYEY